MHNRGARIRLRARRAARRQPWLLADPGAFQLQNDSLTSISRIFSMARDGARPFGQTSVQFMIVRQRNSR